MKKIILLFLLTVSLIGCSRQAVRQADTSLSVLLAQSEGFTVTSTNPARTAAGQDVSFTCELADGYEIIDLPDNVKWDDRNQILSVLAPAYPTTVTPLIGYHPQKVRFFVENATGGGRVAADREQGTIYAGVDITVTATPKENFAFVGWSLNKTLENGGKILSEEENYTFTLETNTTLYANFRDTTPVTQKENIRLMLYNANGGTCRDGSQFYWQEADVTNFKSPNSLWDDGTFTRDGYVLLEYNTRADGTGEPYSLGSKVILPKDTAETQILYCIWAKETPASDFTVTGDKEVTITGYTGDDETVVIPLTINGKKVTGIAKGAFRNKNFTTLVLSKNLRTVASNAFQGCTKMETLYLFDTIMQIYDDTFDTTPNWHSMIICAAMAPRYTASREGCYRYKWERLTLTDKPRVIVVSGSSSYIGLNTPQMEELLDNQYTVVNFGTIANTTVMVYLEFISHFTNENDIVIHAPENHDYQYGRADLVWRLYRDLEDYNNVWRYIDISHYKLVFSEFSTYNQTRSKMKERTYYETNADVNQYGDFTRITPMNKPTKKGSYTITYSLDTMTAEGAENMRMVYQMVLDSGAKMYFSHAPQNYNALTEYAKTREAQLAYMEDLKQKIQIPMISDIADCIYPGEYIYDDDFHVNDAGRTIRTERLANDLLAQLEKERNTK